MQKSLKDFFVYGKKTSQKFTQIYSQRKGADSPGSFRFERARETNFRFV